MTPAEFNKDFYPHLVTAFPAFEEKLGKLTQQMQNDVITKFQYAAREVSVTDAKEAIAKLLTSDFKTPYYLEDYRTEILSTARGVRRNKTDRSYKPGRMVGGQWAYDCPLCKDDGLREVWSPSAHAAVRKNAEGVLAGKVTLHTCFVRCECAAGDRYGAWDKPPPVYSADKGMILVPEFGSMSREKMRRKFVETIQERDANKPRSGGIPFDCGPDAPYDHDPMTGLPT